METDIIISYVKYIYIYYFILLSEVPLKVY